MIASYQELSPRSFVWSDQVVSDRNGASVLFDCGAAQSCAERHFVGVGVFDVFCDFLRNIAKKDWFVFGVTEVAVNFERQRSIMVCSRDREEGRIWVGLFNKIKAQIQSMACAANSQIGAVWQDRPFAGLEMVSVVEVNVQPCRLWIVDARLGGAAICGFESRFFGAHPGKPFFEHVDTPEEDGGDNNQFHNVVFLRRFQSQVACRQSLIRATRYLELTSQEDAA